MIRGQLNIKSITPTSTASECSIPSEDALSKKRRPTPEIPRLNINNNKAQLCESQKPNKSVP